MDQILITLVVQRAIAQVCQDMNRDVPPAQCHRHLYPRRLACFPATNANSRKGAPFPHWEIRVESAAGMLRTAQIHDIDQRHDDIQQNIDVFMRQHVGPVWRTSIGAERAMKIASYKMVALGDKPFEADRIKAEAT